MTSSGPRVAVIGGGIAGLVCACRLGQLGINNVVVFDTGKRAAGGRCASRLIEIDSYNHIFDHAAQYFTVTDPQFAKVTSFLIRQGAAREWKGRIGQMTKSGKFRPRTSDDQVFIGTRGLQSVAECLASQVHMEQPVWIGQVCWESKSQKWQVDKYGFFDYLVVAHNGKCADQLMANAGVPHIHSLLRVKFGDHVIEKDTRMQLSSLWVMLVAFPRPLKLQYDGLHIRHDMDITWMGNNSSKYKSTSTKPNIPGLDHTSTSSSKTECWTVLSTRKFGSSHKVSQENIPPKKVMEVTELLLAAFSRVTKIPSEELNPCYSQVQLWGAAVPMNVWDISDHAVFDTGHQVGVCGDWLVSPCIQGAALSGLKLAEKIHAHSTGLGSNSSFAAQFRISDGDDIGAFPMPSLSIP